MQSVLIDTDIAIDFLRGIPESKDLLLKLWQQGLAYISILTIYELYAGMKMKEQNATDAFIDACQVEPLSATICKKAGELYRNYREQGLTLTTVDCLIFATAKMKKHKVATHNIKHYPDKHILYSF